MTFCKVDKFYIPTEWTAKQATTVWEFLEEIATAIWEVHEKGILENINIKNSMLEPYDPSDDSDFFDQEDCIDDDIPL